MCRGHGIPASSRSRLLAPTLPVPGGPSLTDLQRLDHGHLVGLRQRAALLGSPHLRPGHPGAAGGPLRHLAKVEEKGGRRGAAEGKHLGAAGLPGAAGKDAGCAWGLLASSTLLPCPVTVLSDTAGPWPRWLCMVPWGVTAWGHKGPHCDPALGPGGAGLHCGGRDPTCPWPMGPLGVPPGPHMPLCPLRTFLRPPAHPRTQCSPALAWPRFKH